MSFRFSWRTGACALWLVIGTALQAQLPTPAVPPPVVPSVGQTNYNSAARPTRKDGLKYLEEELSRAFQFLSGGRGALEGVLAPMPVQAPPPQTVVITRTPKEDNSEDWSSLGKSRDDRETDDSFKLPGKNRPDRKSANYDNYNQIRESRAGINGPAPRRNETRTSSVTRNSRSEDDDNLPGSVREKERTLREKLFGKDSSPGPIFNPEAARSFSEIFNPNAGSRDGGPSRSDLQAHHDYLDRYRQVLSPAAPTANSLQQLPQASTPTTVPPQSAGGLTPDPYAPTIPRDAALPPGSLSSLLNRGHVPDLDAKVLNQWNPMYRAPSYEPPKPQGPRPVPMAEMPRRHF